MEDDTTGGKPRQSGAPQAGGATTHGSRFGGRSGTAALLRALARWSRAVEALCYRRLRELDEAADGPEGHGRPNRVREAEHPPHHVRPD